MINIIKEFNIEVKFKQVKVLRLYISRSGQPKLTIPLGTPETLVNDFLQKNREWLKHAIKRSVEKQNNEKKLTQHKMEEGEPFYYLGKQYTLHYVQHSCPSSKVELNEDKLLVYSSSPLNATQTRRIITSWYYNKFKQIVNEYVNYWIVQMKERPLSEIHIKHWKSRWGSMNPMQRIVAFNIQLIFYPIKSIELIVVHELCHLKEHSHNAHFHALMKHYLPDYKVREEMLKTPPSANYD